MSILSTNHRLISIGESYSAGNGIDITDQVISVTGDATPYSAGENIDIQDHIISGKDWSQDITDASSNAYNETTAWVQENYANSADMTYISAVVDTKLDSSAWSTVSGNLATEDYVIMADNINYNRITSYIEDKDYANKDFVLDNISGAVSGKLDTTSFSTVSGTFLTAVDLTPYYTTAEADSLSSMLSGAIDYVSANAGDDFPQSADEAIQTYQQYSGTYLTSHQDVSYKLDTSSFTAWSASQLASQFELSAGDGISLYDDNVNKITRIDVTAQGGNPEVETLVQTNSGVWNEVTNKLDSTAFSTVSGSFLTAHQSLDGYATENWVTGQGYITSVSIPESGTWNDVSTTVQTNSAAWAQGGGVPQSAFDELKASYDALSSLFATYSGQWLLPNEGV
jgi:hypothetical protein